MTTEAQSMHPAARQTSVLAVVSLVSGLLWFLWIGSIIAVITGHAARKEVREQGYNGDTLAVIGLVLGYLGLASLAWLTIMWVAGDVIESLPK